MDALDIRILRAMGLMPYGPRPQGPNALKPGHIAGQVGVSPETVRERVSRMEEAGVIQGYELYPNLRHLGLEGCGFLFVVEDDGVREGLPDAVAPIEGLMAYYAFLGPEVCIDLSYRSASDLERKLKLLGHLTGDPRPTRFFFRTMPPVERPLTRLDWRILQALRGRAARPLSEVAKEVGISYRTVKRRFDRMAREGSFFRVPVLNPARDPGMIPTGLLFTLDEGAGGETRAAILKAYDDEFVDSDVPASPEFGSFGLLSFARSPQHVEELRQRGAPIAGVSRVRAMIYTNVLDLSAWVDDVIASRASGSRET